MPNRHRSAASVIALTALVAASSGHAQSGVFVDSGQSLGNDHSRSVALGDVDNDGDLDAYVANAPFIETGTSRLWINQGGTQAGTEGVFLDSGQALGTNNSQAVALGDLDGDSDLDAFVGNQLASGSAANRVWINMGLNSGTFTDSGQAIGNSGSWDIALGDIDGDADLDAIAANVEAGESNSIAINQGGDQGGSEGEFQLAAGSLGTAQAGGVSLADVDGDGDLDALLAVAFGAGLGNQVWINQGGAQGGTAGVFVDSGQRLGSRSSIAIETADLDGDGDTDVFAANSGITPEDTVWLNQGGAQNGTAGVFMLHQTLPTAIPSSRALLGDLDADGDIDAMVTRFNQASDQGNAVWLNDGTGQFTDTGQSLGANASTGGAIGELDGDGDPDAFIVNDGSSAGAEPNRVWLNNQNPPLTSDLAVHFAQPEGVFDVHSANEEEDHFNLTVTNNGPDDAQDVLVGWSAGSPSLVPLDCDSSGPPDTCAFATLPDQQDRQLEITVFDGIGSGSNLRMFQGSNQVQAVVTAQTSDDQPQNNVATAEHRWYDCGVAVCFVDQWWCFINGFSLPARANPTPGVSSADDAQGASDFLPQLGVYHLVRRMMLNTTSGARLNHAYNQHSAEIFDLTQQQADIRNAASTTLELWEPNLAALAQGQGESAVISSAQVTALDDLLNRLTAAGSAALQQTIADERDNLGPLADWIGMTINEARDQVIPGDTISEQGFERPETLTD